jgi:hypothetical protein
MSASVDGGGPVGSATGPANSSVETRTVVINWVEHSHHRAVVRVPLDFNPDECDLENSLAELSDDGFEFLERAITEVRDDEFDPGAEFFDPPRYDDGMRS